MYSCLFMAALVKAVHYRVVRVVCEQQLAFSSLINCLKIEVNGDI